MFCLLYLQHHKDQLEVVIWVKDHFKKGLCQKINILAFFRQKSAFEFEAAMTQGFTIISYIKIRCHFRDFIPFRIFGVKNVK